MKALPDHSIGLARLYLLLKLARIDVVLAHAGVQ